MEKICFDLEKIPIARSIVSYLNGFELNVEHFSKWAMNTKECKKLSRQAAGHDGPLTDSKEMLLFKPSTIQEIAFYEELNKRSLEDSASDDVSLQEWVPTFLGVLNENPSNLNDSSFGKNLDVVNKMHLSAPVSLTGISQSEEKTYLVLENLLYGYSRPNVLDIKLGRVLWDEHASEDKKERLQQVSNSTTSGTLGFRVCGMNIHRNAKCASLNRDYVTFQDDDYILLNKHYGRNLPDSDVLSAFEVYFGDDSLSAAQRSQLISVFLTRLQLFYNTLLNEEIRMISSSLLFIYDSDSSKWDDINGEHPLLPNHFVNESDGEDEEEDGDFDATPTRISSLSLIDFAHSRFVPGSGIDNNVICGVESLIEIFSELNTKYAR